MSRISRSKISIRLFGAGINPDFVTESLGFIPTSAARTGERIIKPNGTERIVKIGFWRLIYDGNNSLDVNEKIELLFGKLTDNLDLWREVTTGLDTADMFCGVFCDKWNEGFTLSQSTMKKISERNLEIRFDIYSPTDTWHEHDNDIS